MTSEPTTAEHSEFRRDATTRLGYGTIAAYAFWLYAFGPAVALLRGELHFSYTLVGAYSVLWSGAAVLVGVGFARAAAAFGRRRLLWAAAIGATAGAALFTAPRSVAGTLAGAAVLGFFGTTVLTATQSVLSDRHGARRDRALVEANVGAGACAVVAPLALGGLAATAPGWRVALAIPPLALAMLFLAYRREPLPQPAAGPAHRRARLPLTCWIFAVLVAVGMGIEFCLIYFGTELFVTTGLSTAAAATAMSSFYFGILAGRVGGAWLSRRTGRAALLLWGSLAVATAGFLLFWLSGQPAPAVAGLLICGIGVANLYPLSLALTLAAAPRHTDAANARSQLLGGCLVVTAPFLLGALADQVGLALAFTVEPGLLVAAAVLLAAGLRAGRLRRTAQEQPTAAAG